MDPMRYGRLQELFHDAVDLEGEARERFLASVEDGLRAELMELLAEDERAVPLLGKDLGAVAAEALEDIPSGLMAQAFGPYRLEKLLGEGGMGLVFLARRDDLGSVAAIKILRDSWLSPSRRERFLAEQRTLAELRHPAIASLYDADTLADGTPWFAMEFVEGAPITDHCEARKCGLQERLALFRRVCEAVQHAHRHLIIHRDLKPSNILVSGAGEVKLLDFGIAKQLAATEDRTKTGLHLMTPAYAAPEQLRGEATGIYTDMYCLGVILYQLLTAKLPEAGVAPSAARHVAASRAAWSELDVLCQTAMHAEPARRYGSVEALLRDLDHFRAGEPLEARPDNWSYRAGKFVGRNRSWLAIAAAVAAMVVFYTVRLREARNEAVAEAARSQRMMRFVLNLFEGGDRYAGPAKDLRVVTLVDRGVDEARALSGDPEAQTELFRTLGDVQRKLGNFEKADTLLRDALEQRRNARGDRHPDYAESLLDLALLRADQARFEDAERLAREGVDLIRRAHPAGHPAIAGALEALGKVLEERGSYEKAIGVMDEAVALRTGSRETTQADLAASLAGLANVHFYAGHYKESEALNRRVLSIHKQVYGPKHPAVAEDLVNLGAIQQDTGNYVEAEKYQREALAITRPFYGEDHPRTAAGLTLVARSLIMQKKLDESAALLNQALAIRERAFGPMHPQVASTLNEVGNVALLQERYAESEAAFKRVVAIYRAAYQGKHYLISIGLSNQASVYMAQKDFARAEPLLREAMVMYRQTLAPTHVNVGIGRIKLGRVLLRLKRHGEAKVETQTGFDILSKQTNPAVSWLNNARKDLAEEDAALRK
ncbi:MAG: serine/threonine protein kinase [Acidobacteria bacterium]|nr:serine/threonine protein kinase [Acidobacteriota bacterium]